MVSKGGARAPHPFNAPKDMALDDDTLLPRKTPRSAGQPNMPQMPFALGDPDAWSDTPDPSDAPIDMALDEGSLLPPRTPKRAGKADLLRPCFALGDPDAWSDTSDPSDAPIDMVLDEGALLPPRTPKRAGKDDLLQSRFALDSPEARSGTPDLFQAPAPENMVLNEMAPQPLPPKTPSRARRRPRFAFCDLDEVGFDVAIDVDIVHPKAACDPKPTRQAEAPALKDPPCVLSAQPELRLNLPKGVAAVRHRPRFQSPSPPPPPAPNIGAGPTLLRSGRVRPNLCLDFLDALADDSPKDAVARLGDQRLSSSKSFRPGARPLFSRSSFGELDFTHCQTAQDVLHDGVDDSRIRACSIWDVMRSWGQVLRQGSEDGISGDVHRRLSRPVGSIDSFLSHSWRHPRGQKLLQLMLVYNLSAAAVAAVLGGLSGFLLHWSGALPLIPFITGKSGWACKAFGMGAYFLAFFFWGEVRSLRSRQNSRSEVFFDKYCVNQAFLQEKVEGIKALGATILRSRRLVVLHSRSYFTRLWTVYEIACFMSVHSADRLVFVPKFMPKAFALMGPGMLLAMYISLGLISYEPALRLFGVTDMSAAAAAVTSQTLLLASVVLCVPPFLKVQMHWHRELDSLQQMLSAFRIQHADCFAETDREHVYRLVANLERSIRQVSIYASDAEALESFNMRVQQLLAPAIRKTFGRVGVQYRLVAVACMMGTLDRLDFVSGSIVDGASARRILLETLGAFEWGLLTLPLNVACGSTIARCGVNLRGSRERLSAVACCLAAMSVAVLLQLPVVTLRSAAAGSESDVALALWLAWMAGEAAAIKALFRSGGSSSLSTSCEGSSSLSTIWRLKQWSRDRVEATAIGAPQKEPTARPDHGARPEAEAPEPPGLLSKPRCQQSAPRRRRRHFEALRASRQKSGPRTRRP